MINYKYLKYELKMDYVKKCRTSLAEESVLGFLN